MKKILFISLLAVISVTAFSQTVGYPYQNIGSTWGNNMQTVNVLKAFYLPKYNDTTTILTIRNDSLGLMFVQKNVFPNKVWYRDSVSTGGHKWTEVSSGSGGSSTFFSLTDVDTTGGLIDGNLFAFQRSSGNLIPYSMGTVTTGNVYYAIDSTNTPPGSPTTGDVYMVGGAGSGAWVGRNYDIATYNGATWDFTDPTTGDIAVVTSTKKTYKYNGSTWVITGGIPLLVGGNNLIGAGLQFGTLTNVANTWIVNGLQRIRVTGSDITFNRGANAYTLPSGRGTSGQVLTTDGAGALSWSSVSAGGITTADNGLTANTATNVRLGGALVANTTISGAFTLNLNSSRLIVDAADSVLIGANKISFASLDSLNGRANVSYFKATRSFFGASTLAYIGVDSNGFRMQNGELYALGLATFSTSTEAFKPLQQDTVTGRFIRKLIDVSSNTQITGVGGVANGFTGASTLTANNVILGNGTSPVTFVAPGSSGNVLQSNGTTWVSASIASGVSSLTNTDSSIFYSASTGAIVSTGIFKRTTLSGQTATGIKIIQMITTTDTLFFGPQNEGTISANKPIGKFTFTGGNTVFSGPGQTGLTLTGSSGGILTVTNFNSGSYSAVINTNPATTTNMALFTSATNTSTRSHYVFRNTVTTGVTALQNIAIDGQSTVGDASNGTATLITAVRGKVDMFGGGAITEVRGLSSELNTGTNSSNNPVTTMSAVYAKLTYTGTGTGTITNFRAFYYDSTGYSAARVTNGYAWYATGTGMFNFDAGSSKFGYGASGVTAANSTVQVDGSFAYAYKSTSVDYTATASDCVIEITGATKTVTLPTAVGCAGRIYTVKLTTSATTGTVATTSSQNIDASTTYSLSAQYKYVTVQSNNANWIIIANN